MTKVLFLFNAKLMVGLFLSFKHDKHCVCLQVETHDDKNHRFSTRMSPKLPERTHSKGKLLLFAAKPN